MVHGLVIYENVRIGKIWQIGWNLIAQTEKARTFAIHDVK